MSSEIKIASAVLGGLLAFEAGSAANQPKNASASVQEHPFVGRSILDPRLGLMPEAQIQPIILQEAATSITPLFFERNGRNRVELFSGARGIDANAGKLRYTTTIMITNESTGVVKAFQPYYALYNPSEYGYSRETDLEVYTTHCLIDIGRDRIYLLNNIAKANAGQLDTIDQMIIAAEYLSLSSVLDFQNHDYTTHRRFDRNSPIEGMTARSVYFMEMQDSIGDFLEAKLQTRTDFPIFQIRLGPNDPIPPFVRVAAIITTPTSTPTSIPTQTSIPRSPTPDTRTIGGKGFTLEQGRRMNWQGGNMQEAYVMAKIGASGIKTEVLGGNAINSTDTEPLVDPGRCYELIPVTVTGPLGNSDILCTIPGTRSATGAPEKFSIRLNEGDRATLEYFTNDLGVEGYILVILSTRGNSVKFLPRGTTMTTETTDGIPTFFLLAPIKQGQPAGASEILGGIPRQAHFSR